MAVKFGPLEAGGVKRVQVGCGPKNLLADWWNVDIRPFDGIDEAMDVTKTWPWSDVLEFVYGEHFLEHLTIAQGMDFLRHAHRALKPGGVIRLSTPSLEWVLKTHFTFGADEIATRRDNWQINRAFYGWGHRFLYSKAMLTSLIQACGFERPTFHSYGESSRMPLKGLERHGGWAMGGGFPSVWILEASKGTFDEGQWTNAKREASEMFLRHVESGH